MAELATFIEARRSRPGRSRPTRPRSPPRPSTRDIATEDSATILLRFENGARGAVNISQISAGRKNSLQYEISGSDRSVAWDSEQPDQMWIGHRERPNEILIKNPALMEPAGRAAAALPGGHVEGFGDTFAAHFRAVYADIAAGRPSATAGLSDLRGRSRRDARQRRHRRERPPGSLGRRRARSGPGRRDDAEGV